MNQFIFVFSVYHKPRNLNSKLMKNTVNQKKSTTLFNTPSFTQIQPIPATGSNLSFVQVPKTVMVQLVESNQNHNTLPIKSETLNVGTSLTNNVEVVYQNEDSSIESDTSMISGKSENSNKRRKKRKRKSAEFIENAIVNFSSIIQRYLDTCKKDDDPDEIFGKLVAGELAKKQEPEKSRLKRNIMQIIWNDDLEC